MGRIWEPLRFIFYFSPDTDTATSKLKSENHNHKISRLKIALSHGRDDKEVRSENFFKMEKKNKHKRKRIKDTLSSY